MGYPNIVFTKADMAAYSDFCLMCCLPSQGHASAMCLWFIFSKSCYVMYSKIGGTYIFTECLMLPPSTGLNHVTWRVLSCASEIVVEQRMHPSTHLSQRYMVSTTRLSQEKWEKVSNIHVQNAHIMYRTGGWRSISPPSSKTKNKITVLN